MKKYIVCIFSLFVIALSAPGQSGVTRLVSYNVGVFSKYQADSMQDIADMMREIGADAVALCELDSCNRRHATFQLKEFAEVMSGTSHPAWVYRYGSAMQWAGGSYGTGLVTSADVIDSFEIKIPMGHGYEPRVCVVAETADYVIAAVHLDHSNEDVRMEQAQLITDSLKSRYRRSRKPVFLCGDFNAVPDSPTLGLLSKDWKVLSETAPTYPSDSPRKCIDYIMALKNRAKYELLDTKVCTEFESADVREASDHLPIYVDVRIID